MKESHLTTCLSRCTSRGELQLLVLSHSLSLSIDSYTNACKGIPLGLAASVPFILQSDTNTASYQTQATFSLAMWPFSLKLLWAPLVDALYSSRIGRRKSWLIPVQYAIGIDLLVLATHVDEWLGREPGNPWGSLGVANPVNIFSLTAAFFGLTLLAATQDIAVDGWALTMLSKRNIGWASTCNTVGQPLGYVIAFILFLCLESPYVSNSFLRVTPVEGKGLISFSGFLYFWGIAFLLTTTLVAVLKHEEQSSLTKPVQKCMDGVKRRISANFSSGTFRNTNDRSHAPMRVLRSDTYSTILRERSTDEDCVELTTMTINGPCADHNDVNANLSTLSTASSTSLVTKNVASNEIEVFQNNTAHSAAELSLFDTYRTMLGILCLKPVIRYICVLFLVKFCFSPTDSITTLKLIERGLSKERLAFLSMLLVPVQTILPLLITRWTNGPSPLSIFACAGMTRLFVSALAIPLVYYVPYFRQQISSATSPNGTHLAVNETLSTHLHQPQYTFSWTFYGLFLAYLAVQTVLANFMFISQMAFHARVSDPVVGGTYMTLLNTAANLAGSLPGTLLLYLVEPLSIRYCSNSDPLKAGLASWRSSFDNNETVVSFVTPPGEDYLLRLGHAWISTNATCAPKAGSGACELSGGTCITKLDGFYLETTVCLLLGLVIIPVVIRPLVRRLDALSPSAYAFRLSDTNLCHQCIHRRRKQSDSS
ncbi:unnamed protein product [Dicrocoelium dendriticum]|nr:unnamed protein product [Dicrocoelium dendriticum]